MSENFDDDDAVWKSPDFIHEIKNSDLRDLLSHNYWLGILVGMVLTSGSFLIGSMLIFTK